MFQETTLEKIQRGKNIIDSSLKIKIRDKSQKLVLLLSKTNIKYKIVKLNELKKFENHPTIYAINHYSAQDTPIACNIIDERCYILAGKQNLGLLDNLFFYIYGSIFVDRKNKEDMQLSKLAMQEYLKRNKSIIMFPEGTWNLDDNLLILNMKWGIIDVVSKAKAQIVPICLDYNRETMECYIKYGEPILIGIEDDKKEAIENLRNIMATMRLDMLQNQKVLKRANVDIDILRRENRSSIDEFPKINIDYEESIIYHPNPSHEEVFEPIKKLQLSKKNMFLSYKNNKGM